MAAMQTISFDLKKSIYVEMIGCKWVSWNWALRSGAWTRSIEAIGNQFTVSAVNRNLAKNLCLSLVLCLD